MVNNFHMEPPASPLAITLDVLKNDEKSIMSQIGQLQGALAYNKQQQSFLEGKERDQQQSDARVEATPDA